MTRWSIIKLKNITIEELLEDFKNIALKDKKHESGKYFAQLNFKQGSFRVGLRAGGLLMFSGGNLIALYQNEI